MSKNQYRMATGILPSGDVRASQDVDRAAESGEWGDVHTQRRRCLLDRARERARGWLGRSRTQLEIGDEQLTGGQRFIEGRDRLAERVVEIVRGTGEASGYAR